MVLDDEPGEGLADDEANVEGLTGIGAAGATGTIEDGDVIGVLEDDVPGTRVGDDLLQIGQTDFLADAHQLGGMLEGHDLPVIAVSEGASRVQPRLVRLTVEGPENPARDRAQDAGHVIAALCRPFFNTRR